MENKEILQKAMQKAEENGYIFPEYNSSFYPLINCEFDYPHFIYNEDFEGSWCLHINEIIFDHNFAKAFWGEEYIQVKEIHKAELEQKDIKKIGYKADEPWFDCEQTWTLDLPKWQYHLQQMVLEKEPLKYLLRFLDES